MKPEAHFINTCWRIIVHSWQHTIRNAWIAAATVAMLVLVLSSVNVLLAVQAFTNQAIQHLEDHIDVIATFTPNASDTLIQQARSYVLSLPQVQDVTFISADQVLQTFRQSHASDTAVQAGLHDVDGNPLGAELVIKAKHTEDYAFILQALQNPQYASLFDTSTYDDHHEAIAAVQNLADQIRLIGSALIALFTLFGMLLTFNTLRVAVYTHREEIGIMRLVGASSAFVRTPFILEGIWLASFAILLSSILFACGVWWINPLLRPLFEGSDPGVTTFFLQNILTIILVETAGLYALVTTVSTLAVGTYLR